MKRRSKNVVSTKAFVAYAAAKPGSSAMASSSGAVGSPR